MTSHTNSDAMVEDVRFHVVAQHMHVAVLVVNVLIKGIGNKLKNAQYQVCFSFIFDFSVLRMPP